jgi:hypothetical protein
MDVYSRKIAGIKYSDITIYTRREADDLGLQYRHWREAEVGSWAITDDEYVGFYYARYDFPSRRDDDQKGRKRFVAYFGFGNLMGSRKTPYHYETRRATGRFQSDKSWSEALASRRVSRMAVKVYVRTLLNDGSVNWDLLGQMLGKKDIQPTWKAKRIFKTEAFKRMVEKELDDLLTEKGINKDYVLSIYQRAIGIAEKDGDAVTMLKGAKDLGEIVGLAPKKLKVTEQWQQAIGGTIQDMSTTLLKAEQSVLSITKTTESTHESDRVRSSSVEIEDAVIVNSDKEAS